MSHYLRDSVCVELCKDRSVALIAAGAAQRWRGSLRTVAFQTARIPVVSWTAATATPTLTRTLHNYTASAPFDLCEQRLCEHHDDHQGLCHGCGQGDGGEASSADTSTTAALTQTSVQLSIFDQPTTGCRCAAVVLPLCAAALCVLLTDRLATAPQHCSSQTNTSCLLLLGD